MRWWSWGLPYGMVTGGQHHSHSHHPKPYRIPQDPAQTPEGNGDTSR